MAAGPDERKYKGLHFQLSGQGAAVCTRAAGPAQVGAQIRTGSSHLRLLWRGAAERPRQVLLLVQSLPGADVWRGAAACGMMQGAGFVLASPWTEQDAMAQSLFEERCVAGEATGC